MRRRHPFGVTRAGTRPRAARQPGPEGGHDNRDAIGLGYTVTGSLGRVTR